jgi:hypothetical protein
VQILEHRLAGRGASSYLATAFESPLTRTERPDHGIRRATVPLRGSTDDRRGSAAAVASAWICDVVSVAAFRTIYFDPLTSLAEAAESGGSSFGSYDMLWLTYPDSPRGRPPFCAAIPQRLAGGSEAQHPALAVLLHLSRPAHLSLGR